MSWSSVAGWCEETLDSADVRRGTRELIRTVSQRFVGFWALQLWGAWSFFQLALDDRLLSLTAVVIWGWFVAQLLRFSNASSAISPGDLYVKSLAVIERSQQSEDAETMVYSVHTPMHKLIQDPALSGRRLVSKRYLVALLYMLLGMACGFAISALWLTAETVLVEGKAEPVLILERIDQAARHFGCWLAATLGGFLGIWPYITQWSNWMTFTGYHESKVLREHQRCLDEWQDHCHQLGLLYLEQTGMELPASPYLDPPYNRRPKLMGWIDPQQFVVVPEPGTETEVNTDAEVEPLKENAAVEADVTSPIDSSTP